jgi:hypothetical protein
MYAQLGRLENYYLAEYQRLVPNSDKTAWEEHKKYATEKLRPLIAGIVTEIKAAHLLDNEIEDIFDLDYLPEIQRAVTEEKRIAASDIVGLIGAGGLATPSGHIKVDRQLLQNETSYDILAGLATTGGSRNFALVFHELLHRTQFQYQDQTKMLAAHNASAQIREAENARQLQRTLVMSTLLMLANAQSLERTAALTIPLVLIGAIHLMIKNARANLKLIGEQLDTGALMEVQAYKADSNVRASNTSAGQLVKQLEQLPYLYGLSSRFRDRIIMGSAEVERLRALDATHDEIARLLAEAKWDDEKVGYNTLEDEIVRRMSERDLDEVAVDGLVDLRRIERDIRFLKIRKLTQERITAAYNTSLVSNSTPATQQQ